MGLLGRTLNSTSFLSVWAAVIWLSARFTPWLDGLPFNPWWLMVGVGLLALILRIIVKGFRWYLLDDEVYRLVQGPAPAAALAGVFVALGLFLKPWFESLPFNPWWLTVLTLPLAGTSLALLLRIRSRRRLNLSRFSVTVGLAVGLAGIVAGGIFLVLWVNPLLRGLGFNPWWLMVGVGLLVMFLPSIFGGAGGYGVARYAYGLVSGPVLSAASVGAFVALGLFLKPWLASLPFNPWWLTVLTLPLVVTLLALLVRFRSEIPFDTTRFNVALGLALGHQGLTPKPIQI